MKTVLATVIAVGVLLGVAVPALAAKPESTRSTFTLSGFCAFDVVVDLTSLQQVRVVKTAQDGTTTTLITGRLSGTLTNADTGASLPINVSDPTMITAHPDGSLDIRVVGPSLVFLGSDDPASQPVFILNFGLSTLHLDDSISFETIGHQVDVCPLLA